MKKQAIKKTLAGLALASLVLGGAVGLGACKSKSSCNGCGPGSCGGKKSMDKPVEKPGMMETR